MVLSPLRDGVVGLLTRLRTETQKDETYDETLERERRERQLDWECLSCGGREFWLAEQVTNWRDITRVTDSPTGEKLLIHTYANRFYPGDGKTIGYGCKTCHAYADTFEGLARRIAKETP